MLLQDADILILIDAGIDDAQYRFYLTEIILANLG